jgi:hypothetical protein
MDVLTVGTVPWPRVPSAITRLSFRFNPYDIYDRFASRFAHCWGSALRSVQFACEGGASGSAPPPQMWIIVVVIEIRDVSRIEAVCCLKEMNPVELHAC